MAGSTDVPRETVGLNGVTFHFDFSPAIKGVRLPIYNIIVIPSLEYSLYSRCIPQGV